MLRQDDFLKGQLVLYAWRAGKQYGGHTAACMIMCAIANRYRAGWGSWLDILDKMPAKSATIEQPTGTPEMWDPTFVHLLHDVDTIFSGSATDLSCGAKYWADMTRIDNPWFKEKVLNHPNRQVAANMNSLTFFKIGD